MSEGHGQFTSDGQAMPGPKLAYSAAEAAQVLGVSEWTVRRMVSAGKLPSLRIERRLLIPAKRLAEWVDAQANAAEKA